ncbi:hypothetical protein Tco_0940138 [Tanacetum coccineum]|uniref:Uncharacterized protein n=1 Tax=Tanacetum coccineum TaxID=301880 RepID=A0ABQ5DPQ8_9ASTR
MWSVASHLNAGVEESGVKVVGWTVLEMSKCGSLGRTTYSWRQLRNGTGCLIFMWARAVFRGVYKSRSNRITYARIGGQIHVADPHTLYAFLVGSSVYEEMGPGSIKSVAETFALAKSGAGCNLWRKRTASIYSLGVVRIMDAGALGDLHVEVSHLYRCYDIGRGGRRCFNSSAGYGIGRGGGDGGSLWWLGYNGVSARSSMWVSLGETLCGCVLSVLFVVSGAGHVQDRIGVLLEMIVLEHFSNKIDYFTHIDIISGGSGKCVRVYEKVECCIYDDDTDYWASILQLLSGGSRDYDLRSLMRSKRVYRMWWSFDGGSESSDGDDVGASIDVIDEILEEDFDSVGIKRLLDDLRVTAAKFFEGVKTAITPSTAKEKAQMRLELKARSTLLMGIPNEHQLKSMNQRSKDIKAQSSNTQNVAIVSSNSTSSTNGVVNTAHGATTASTQATAVNSTTIDNLSDSCYLCFLCKSTK